MEPAVIYNELVRASLARTLKKYEMDIAQKQSHDADCWQDIVEHVDGKAYGYQMLEDAFLWALDLFEMQQGKMLTTMIFEKLTPDQYCASYVADVMERMGDGGVITTFGVMVACASFLNHAIIHQIEAGVALKEQYVNDLLATLMPPSKAGWKQTCNMLIEKYLEELV
jgi:hypothetical protein